MMAAPRNIEIGAQLPVLEFGPLTRHRLALYCGGSGDHNPIHVDIDFARQAGYDDVFAHGMLSMAVLGRLLTGWVPQDRLREFGVRFTAITPVNSTFRCTGHVVDIFEQQGETCLRLDVSTQLEDETVTLAGWAVVAAD